MARVALSEAGPTVVAVEGGLEVEAAVQYRTHQLPMAGGLEAVGRIKVTSKGPPANRLKEVLPSGKEDHKKVVIHLTRRRQLHGDPVPDVPTTPTTQLQVAANQAKEATLLVAALGARLHSGHQVVSERRVEAGQAHLTAAGSVPKVVRKVDLEDSKKDPLEVLVRLRVEVLEVFKAGSQVLDGLTAP